MKTKGTDASKEGLTAFARTLEEIAREIIHAGHSVPPAAYYVRTNGRFSGEILSFNSYPAKDAAADHCRRRARKMGTAALVYVCEAWTKSTPIHDTIEIERIAREGLAEDPERQECISVAVFTPRFALGWTVRFERLPDGSVLWREPDQDREVMLDHRWDPWPHRSDPNHN